MTTGAFAAEDTCVAGLERDCDCPDDVVGVQRCGDDGRAWGECDCAVTVDRCGVPWAEADACGSCLAGSCCDVVTTCGSQPACADALTCLGLCPDAADSVACRATCLAAPGAAARQDLLAPVLACLAVRCDEACASCGLHSLAPDTACQECLDRTGAACGELKDCVGDPGCGAGALCFGACTDPVCSMDCLQRGERPKDLLQLRQTLIGACGGACGYGADWACVGEYAAGGRDAPEVTFRLNLRPFEGDTPAQGVHVKACALTDLQCDRPAAEGVADEAGGVDLLLDLGHFDQGFEGYFEVNGELDGSPLLPLLVHFARPIRMDSTLNSLVLRQGVADTMAFLIGSPLDYLDPELGHITVTGHDCRTQPAPGVTFETSPAAGPRGAVYAKSMIPDPALQATDASGVAFLIELDPGAQGAQLYTVVMRSPDTGEALGSRRVVVRKGYGTNLFVEPSPAD